MFVSHGQKKKRLGWTLRERIKPRAAAVVCVCCLLWKSAVSPPSQALSSLSIWNINVQARLAMPSQASCFLPIDFPSVCPHTPPPPISRGESLQSRSTTPLLPGLPQNQPGLFTILAWLISAESLEQLQTSEDNPRCWKEAKEGGVDQYAALQNCAV